MKYFDLRFVIILLFIGGLSCSSNYFPTTDDISPSQTRKNILNAQESFILFAAESSIGKIATGSGFIVSSNEKESYIMSAAHVCLLPDIGELSTGLKDIALSATNLQNQKTTDLKIHYMDAENDICVLKTTGLKDQNSIDIAQNKIEKGAEIYAITAPRGISYLEHMTVPLQKGWFLGKKSKTEEIYSLRISYGSSGGMIISKRGEVVGIVQSKLKYDDRDYFDELTISPSFEKIKMAEKSY